MQDPAQALREASSEADRQVQRSVTEGERAADRTASRADSAVEVRVLYSAVGTLAGRRCCPRMRCTEGQCITATMTPVHLAYVLLVDTFELQRRFATKDGKVIVC